MTLKPVETFVVATVISGATAFAAAAQPDAWVRFSEDGRWGIEWSGDLITSTTSLSTSTVRQPEMRASRAENCERPYEISSTGLPSTSIFGSMPSPGWVDAASRPCCRCGAPWAVLTVT